ncbi:MAG: M20/M25/M40 family metallo-hydrolase [Oscillospiraceae bacterium]|nr:M20/M25/M40 family metallo-hydrolase [Oscillospiraceae bacterium]
MYGDLKDLCAIPAPSHFEHERAEYCKKWLVRAGADGVYIDDALNVVFPLGCDGSDEITVFAAHTDTVFPDREPMPYTDDGEKIYSPGVGDNTASVVSLLYMAKYFIENNIVPPKGILFVCNSCEEGLGNLKGVRQLFSDFEGRIKQFVTFDNNYNVIANHCAGSHRYEVEVLTQGGHSYQAFGRANANAVLAKMIAEIYKLSVPEKEGTRTTYNVGIISGGTSINTISQKASMLCEYRSNDRECLEYMRQKFEAIFDSVRSDEVKVNVTKIGDRPCENVDQAKVEELAAKVVGEINGVVDDEVVFRCSSTDCNIPLSLGIPAINMGIGKHYGSHTREEYLIKNSLIPGLEIAIRTGIKLMEE